MNDWKSTTAEPPPENVAVDTAIFDARGQRNHQPLIRCGRLWFFADKGMYVYYEPTHWRELKAKVQP